jgi:hypothetical protein
MLKNAYDTELNIQKSVEDYIIDHWKDSVILTGEGHSLERVPFVSSPPEVVKRMLEVAVVGPSDIVCDLQCFRCSA